MLWTVLKIVLTVLGCVLGLVLVLCALILIACCFNVGVRFSNFGEKLLVIRYGLLRFRILPKKEKPEPTEEERLREEKKKARRAERKKRRQEKRRLRREKRKVRKAIRRERKKAREAAKAKKKPKLSHKADWLSEPTEGKTRAIVESVFDVLPKAGKLIHFEDIEFEWVIRGENPARTGIAYGRAAELFGIVYPLAQRILWIGKHRVRVNADFAHGGKSSAAVDITALLRPIRLVGLAISFVRAFLKNKRRYCKKAKITHTTFRMKPNGGKKHGGKTENKRASAGNDRKGS